MNEVLFVFYYTTAVGLLGQLCMFGLQLRAYLQNRHSSFVLLAASTVLGLVYIGVLFAPIFLRWGEANYYAAYITAACLVTLQLLVGLVGTVKLFNSYTSLAQRGGT